MDNVDLQDLRKRLHSYKRTGFKSVMKILDYLDNNDVDANQIASSKIYKTIKTLADLDVTKESDSTLNQEDCLMIKERSDQIYKKMKRIVKELETSDRKPSTQSEQTNDKQITEGPPEIKAKTSAQDLMSVDELLKSLNLPEQFEPQRFKILQRLLQITLQNKHNIQGLKKVNDQDLAKLVRKLEYETNLKYQSQSQQQQYQNTIKQMIKYIQMDSDGSVRQRLVSGLLDIHVAILLRAEDWTCQQKLQEARMKCVEVIKANDLQHYKEVAKLINKDVALSECQNCREKQLKLVDEKQTRASDEPSTKFWECLNCGMSDVTNG